MKTTDMIDSIELSFEGYSEFIEVRGHDNVRSDGRYLSIDASTPFDLYDYPLAINGRDVEIESMKGTIDRTINICLDSVDTMTGQVIVRIMSDEFQSAEITECSDTNYSLAEITDAVNKAFLNNDLLHGEEGLEVTVNIAKEYILE